MSPNARKLPGPRSILLWLGIGTIASVAAAWGCAAWSSTFHTPPYGGYVSIDGRAVGFAYYHSFGVSIGRGSRSASLDGRIPARTVWPSTTSPGATTPRQPPAWACLPSEVAQRSLREDQSLVEFGAGFPFRMLRCHTEAPPTLAGRTMTYHVIGGVALKPRFHAMIGATGFEERALPLIPIWWGLAGNASLYALILGGSYSAIGAFHRHRRLRSGRCPRCDYPQLELGRCVCPECGWSRPDPLVSASLTRRAVSKCPERG